MRTWITAVLVGMLLVSCQPDPDQHDSAGSGRAASETSAGDFLLRVVSEKYSYEEEENIHLTAKLVYTGEEEEVQIEYRDTPFRFELFETSRSENLVPVVNNESGSAVLEQGLWLEEKYSKDIELTSEFAYEFVEDTGFPAGNYEINVQGEFSYYIDEERKSTLIDTSLTITVY